MSILEKYGLHFFKAKSPINNSDIPFCRELVNSDQSNRLDIISQLVPEEIEGLTDEIDKALNGEYYEQYYSTDGLGSESNELNYPDIIIGQSSNSIPMTDMKEILQAWYDFVVSTKK